MKNEQEIDLKKLRDANSGSTKEIPENDQLLQKLENGSHQPSPCPPDGKKAWG